VAKNDIEKIILGAFLLDEKNFWNVQELLSLKLFQSDDHQKIYAVINELACTGKAIRTGIVASRIGALASGQDVDAYLSALQHIASKEEYLPVGDYLEELANDAKRRDLVAFSEQLLKASKDLNLDPDRLIDRAAQKLADLSNTNMAGMESTISSNLRNIADASEDRKFGAIAIKPVLRGIEYMTGDIPLGSLLLWGGGPGSAKTAVAIQQAIHTGETEPTTLFQLEMSGQAMVTRATQHHTGVRSRDVMSGMTPEQTQQIRKAGDDFSLNKLLIVTPKRMDITTLKLQAYAHKRKYGTKLFIVDHLKLLGRNEKGYMDPVKAAYENARDLKELAKSLDAVFIVLCQLTKAGRQREESPEPEMEDFFGGSLEEHADLMLANFNRHAWLVRNPPVTRNAKPKVEWEDKVREAKGTIEIYKLKDRFGDPRDFRIFNWDGANTRVNDLPTEADQQMLPV
jgi:replicative DNA helicase